MTMKTIVETVLMMKARSLSPRAKRLRLPRPPKPRPPIQLERQYLKDLTDQVVIPLAKLVEKNLVPLLPAILDTAREELAPTKTFDGQAVRRDANYSREIDRVFEAMKVAFARELTDREVNALAAKYAAKGQAFNKEQIADQFGKVLGVKPITAEPYLEPVMRQFVDTNTSLIRSISDDYFAKLQRDTYEHIQAGVYNKEYAKKLTSEFAEEYKNQFEAGALKNRVHNAEARSRLIARDQISKYNGQLNQTRQTALGVTKYRWLTSGDDRVRESHASKNGKIFSWDDPPADTGHPGEDFQCFPGDVSIDLCLDTIKGFRRWYDGKLALVVTQSGKTIRCTPNHPFLTRRGWVKAQELNEFDDLILLVDNGVDIAEENIDKVKTTFLYFFRFLSEVFHSYSAKVTKEHFHGDGADSDINIVCVNRGLRIGFKAGVMEKLNQLFFPNADSSGFHIRSFDIGFFSSLGAFCRNIGLLCERLPFFRRKPSHSEKVGLAYASDTDPVFPNDSADRRATNTESLTYRQLTFSENVGRYDRIMTQVDRRTIPIESVDGSVDPSFSQFLAEIVGVDSKRLSDVLEQRAAFYKSDRVQNVTFSEFSGHVYNLETRKGWYIADDVIVSNCRCIAQPVFDEGVTDNPELAALLKK
jgi:SPP1 gp7 family putative phage head morphogenesis protein